MTPAERAIREAFWLLVAVLILIVLTLGQLALAAETGFLGLQYGSSERENLNLNLIDAYARTRTTATTILATDYGVDCDGTNETTAMQAAMDACWQSGTRSGTVLFPRGDCRFTQLRIYPGCSVVGVGMGVAPQVGTSFTQLNGVNASAFVNDPTALASTDFWHWTTFRDFDLRKATPVTDTLGSGIDVDTQTGEGFQFFHIQVSNFPHSGIRLRHGGTTPVGIDMHLHCNGQYGLSLEHDGRSDGHGASFTWHSPSFTMVSGDGNGTALIGVKTASNTGTESFAFRDVKAENSSSFAAPCSTQNYVAELDDLNSAHVYLENVAALDANNDLAGDGVVNIKTSNAAVTLSAVASNVTNLIDDDVASVDIADDNGVLWLDYSGGVCRAMTTSGLRVGTGAGCAAGLGTANTRVMTVLGGGTTGAYAATDVTTDNTNKFGRYDFWHFDRDDELLCGINGFSTTSTGVLAYGGSTSSCNAATAHAWYAAANNTTTTGTKWMDGDLNGLRPVPPTAQTIAAGGTITADACGGQKRITSGSAVTTDTTNTFTAPAASNAGCAMDVCQITANSTTLDSNSNFSTWNGQNITLAVGQCVRVHSDGTTWRQITLPVNKVIDGLTSLSVVPPLGQTIAAGGTVTADACGSIKRINSAGAVVTDTTNTFTDPANAQVGCLMDVCNSGANAIDLDLNANFDGAAADDAGSDGDIDLGAGDCIRVGSDGTIWRQLSRVVDN